MPPALDRRNLQDPPQILEALESFLAAAKNPVLLESGRPAIAIDRDRLRVERSAGSVVLESWGPDGNTIRRITSVVSRTRKRIELTAKRFAGADVRLSIIDSATANVSPATSGHSSEAFLERLLSREFPHSRVTRLSGGPDLQHSLSGRHVRCLMQERGVCWAAVAAPPLAGPDAYDCAITTGLLWLDLLRRTIRRRPVVGLRLFLPRGYESRSARLLQFLSNEIAAYELYGYDTSGAVGRIDVVDAGNRDGMLTLRRANWPLGPPLQDWLRELEDRPGVESIPLADGALSLRVFGIEFAVVLGRRLFYGLNERIGVTAANFDKALALADELAAFRNPRAANRQHPLYTALPERWLESQLRRNIQLLDPSLGSGLIYSQPKADHGVDRGIIDLLSLDQAGRLVVMEIKESANLQLPLQALDYWIQVVRLSQTFPKLIEEAFPNRLISSEAPRLVLIAPALDYHPTTETIARFFSVLVPLERIGIGSAWRSTVETRYHQYGSSRPDSSILDH